MYKGVVHTYMHCYIHANIGHLFVKLHIRYWTNSFISLEIREFEPLKKHKKIITVYVYMYVCILY